MESGIQSSFIPQDAATPTSARTVRTGGLSDLLFLLAIVLLVASAALGGAMFVYKQYVTTSAASKVEQLKRAQAAFEPSLIQQITRLDDRMQAADQVLGSHLAPTDLFIALEDATLSTVGFKSLDLQAPDSLHITAKFSGVAQSVNSIALEADLLSKNGVFTNPIFSDISRQADGVHFTLTTLVNPAAINYVQTVSGHAGVRTNTNDATQQAAPSVQTQVQTQTQTQPTPFGAPTQASPQSASPSTNTATPPSSGAIE